jgi:MoaA/NifB/PqqE/SkfB family radical SAM enzyme
MNKVRDHFYTCHAGINVASVLADGSISACPSIRSNFNQGNIYTDNFWQVWNDRFKPFRDRNWAHTGACAIANVALLRRNGMHLHDDEGKLMVCHSEE